MDRESPYKSSLAVAKKHWVGQEYGVLREGGRTDDVSWHEKLFSPISSI